MTPPTPRKGADYIQETVVDSDGAWIYLKMGYQMDGQHAIHEDTMGQAKKRLSEVEPCTCRECKPTPPPTHTATPWKRHDINGGFFDANGNKVNIKTEANAAHIVTCVNAHEELVAALMAIRLQMEYELPRPAARKLWELADKALSRAEGSK